MSAKSIILKIVLGLLAVAVLAGGIYSMLKPPTSDGVEDISVFSADAASVKRVEIKGDENYALEKTDEGWVMEDIEGIAVDQTFADTLVKSLCNIESPMHAGSGALSDYGLDNPAIEAKLVFEKGEERVLVGNASGEYYYVKMAKERDIYIVSAADLYMVFLEKIKYLDNTVLTMYADDVTALSYKNVALEKTDDGWMEKAPYDFVADADKVKTILDSLSDISAMEIVNKDEVDVKAGEEVTVTLIGGNTLSFEVCGNFIIYKDTDHAYKVSGDELSFLDVTGFDLLSKYVAPIAISEVSAVKFISDEGVIEFTIEAPASEAPVFYKNGSEVSEAIFRGFYQNLMGLVFTKEGTAEGRVLYEIAFSKTDGEVYSVKFAETTENELLLDINGLKGFTVNKKTVTDIFEMAKELG